MEPAFLPALAPGERAVHVPLVRAWRTPPLGPPHLARLPPLLLAPLQALLRGIGRSRGPLLRLVCDVHDVAQPVAGGPLRRHLLQPPRGGELADPPLGDRP